MGADHAEVGIIAVFGCAPDDVGYGLVDVLPCAVSRRSMLHTIGDAIAGELLLRRRTEREDSLTVARSRFTE